MSERVRTIAMSADLRTFMLIINVPVPVEDQVVELVPNAKFPFEIISVDRKCGGDSDLQLDLLFRIDALDIVDWDDADSTGIIVCEGGVLVESLTNGSSDFVAEGGLFDVTFTGVPSDMVDVVIQVTCRRTEDNVVVSA